MAPRQGQPPQKPKPEELIAAFKEKFETFRDETKSKVEETGSALEKIREQDEEIKILLQKQQDNHAKLVHAFVDKFTTKVNEKFDNLKVEMMEQFEQMSKQLSEETGSKAGCEDQLAGLAEVVEDIQEKIIEFEERKRNNLIFYGVKGENRETPAELVSKVCKIIVLRLAIKILNLSLDFLHYPLLFES